jgi:peptidyl-prolyl cis-trans isomerase D
MVGVTADLKKSKQEEKAKLDAESLLSELKNGTPVETAVKNRSLVLKQTGYFKKADSIPEIGYDRAVVEAAFDLSDRKPLPEKVVKGSKGFYVVHYKSQKEPDGQTYEKDRVRTKNELLNRKKTKTFTEWLARLRKNSTIEITEAFEG